MAGGFIFLKSTAINQKQYINSENKDSPWKVLYNEHTEIKIHALMTIPSLLRTSCDISCPVWAKETSYNVVK